MPKLHEFENDPDDGGCQPNLCKGWDNNQWHVVYRSSIHITDWYDDPIDAAFEMVCWLKENFDIYMNIKVYKRKKFLKYLKDYEEKHSKKIKSEENRRLWNKILKNKRYE